jgi:hypothetical protein
MQPNLLISTANHVDYRIPACAESPSGSRASMSIRFYDKMRFEYRPELIAAGKER